MTDERGNRGRYDRGYFDKWYRDPRYRVKTAVELRRQVRFVLSTAEWILNRPVKSVLDVGCGEGQWRSQLRALRPSLEYEGVDPSSYVVERYGKRRNIRQGGIGELLSVASKESYDLVICCGMLNYLSLSELEAGVKNVAQLTGGVAYLELFTAADSYEGDVSWPEPARPGHYLRLIKGAGFHPVGLQCYVPTSQLDQVAALERLS